MNFLGCPCNLSWYYVVRPYVIGKCRHVDIFMYSNVVLVCVWVFMAENGYYSSSYLHSRTESKAKRKISNKISFISKNINKLLNMKQKLRLNRRYGFNFLYKMSQCFGRIVVTSKCVS